MTTDQILIEATKKLIGIDKIDEWNNELLAKAPPVLWFGNSKSKKKKVLTVGANPSRWEFLNRSEMKKCPTPSQKGCYEQHYLSNQRFFHLNNNQKYDDILDNKSLRDGIIESFDNYFISGNAYSWFGLDKTNSYNVEGVLRGLGASYFKNDLEYGACHIDIFPFATISNFTRIQSITKRDILSDQWAVKIFDELLRYLNPKVILVFGKTNVNYFSEYYNVRFPKRTRWEAEKGKGKCDYWSAEYGNYQIIGISVNLGNPKGFDAIGLNELGEYLRRI